MLQAEEDRNESIDDQSRDKPQIKVGGREGARWEERETGEQGLLWGAVRIKSQMP